ncbi:MAG: amidohydrolase family protein [Anaerolineaceae bacterium]|nr:amidohydrolase family protein [Anaerolineaceae bacterium]
MKIDTHQHFWNLSEVAYPWLIPAYGPIYATFEPKQLEPMVKAAGIDKTVLVQSANSYEDTASMLVHADYNDWIGAVIGWVDLLNPDATNERLEQYKKHPKFRGMRHLIHEEKNPDWVIQEVVIESLKVLASHDMIFEVVAVFPNHLKHVPTLSAKVPNLKMAIDHLAKPPIKDKVMSPWSDQMKAAAENPNVYAKVSGLNTAAAADWSDSDLKPYIDFAVEAFSPNRLMFGSDWPVCILAGDYNQVWTETNKAIAGYSQADKDALLGGTAAQFYKL